MYLHVTCCITVLLFANSTISPTQFAPLLAYFITHATHFLPYSSNPRIIMKSAFSSPIPLSLSSSASFPISISPLNPSKNVSSFHLCITRTQIQATACLPQPTAPSSKNLTPSVPISPRATVVLIAGFETFNLATYTAAARIASHANIHVTLLTDNNLTNPTPSIATTLAAADVIFCSLLFDYDQVEWLRAHIPPHATVFAFESALEIMSATRVGTFSMKPGRSMPPVVRSILQKLGLVGREEDKLAGYLAMLKGANRFLKVLPGRTPRDLSNWLTVYSYWNAGGTENVAAMFEYIVRNVLEKPPVGTIPPVVQIPNVGLLHPSREGYFFEHPAEYVKWYGNTFPERASWPRVAILLYRKHVVSKLPYIQELIHYFEKAAIVPFPVFITGVEAHIIVRDYLTSVDKEKARARGDRIYGSYRRDKIAAVDAVVSTIGYVRSFEFSPLLMIFLFSFCI